MHLCDFARRSERRVEELVRLDPVEATKDSHGKGFPTVYPYGSRTVEFVNPQTSRRGLDRSMHRERTTYYRRWKTAPVCARS